MFSIWLVDTTAWLIGFVHEINGRWIARHRGDTADKSHNLGWSSRTDAAVWLLLTGGFAKQRRAAA